MNRYCFVFFRFGIGYQRIGSAC